MRHLSCTVAVLLAFLTPACALAQGSPDATVARDIAAAYNLTGDRLMRQFATKPGNIVFSPTSIGIAMSMALYGARGATADEMRRVLSLTANLADTTSRGEGQLTSILNGYDRESLSCPSSAKLVGDKCVEPIGANGRCDRNGEMKDGLCLTERLHPTSARLSIANALMLTGKNGDLISTDFTQNLTRSYGAEVFENATLDAVNGWVKKKTEGKIERIIDTLSNDAAAVILNAVYFKGRWASAFAKATREEPFRLTRDVTAPVKTMHQTDNFAIVAGKAYRAIQLPYTVSELSMIIVLPDAVDGADAIGKKLDTPAFSELSANLNAAPRKLVDLSLPKFKTGYAVGLVEAFKVLGLTRPFRDDADFSGMTGKAANEDPIYIGDIRHRAMIDVDEDGTEAAAATAITMMKSIAPQPKSEEPEVFRVDRPFLFYVTDNATGAILFQGRISDPRMS